jgi:hypothetical protein
MTTSTMNSNGHVSRKTLSNQIDRLDGILDGLAEGLNESVADAVKDVIAQVVSEAVETAVKEVLSNPDLLRAALAQHIPPAPPTPPVPAMPERRSFMEMVKGGWNWLCKKANTTASHATTTLGKGFSWCLEKVKKGCDALWNRRQGVVAACVGTVAALGAVGLSVWQLRRSVSIALAAGLVAGVSGYVAGPVVCGLLSALGGLAVSLSTMILWPIWKLLSRGHDNNTLE